MNEQYAKCDLTNMFKKKLCLSQKMIAGEEA